MKVLVIGKGGRENALAWKVNQSSLVKKVYVAPGNPGTREFCENINIEEDDIKSLVLFAKNEGIDLTIVGPETTLALGIVDVFQENNLRIFGPRKEVARLESSKDFAKKIMEKYSIPTGKYKTFYELGEAKLYVEKQGAPIVIKEDGLKAGKGVTVAMKKEEAYKALEAAFSIPDNKVVIEEYLDGFEFSLIALAHEDKIIPLEVGQDHKRVFDGDKGPNTGGMGVYSPVRKVTEEKIKESVEKIIRPTLEGLQKEGLSFTGFIFAGIMDTKEGVKTIEFNVRFGDPEAEAILPRMKSDLVQLILDILEENVDNKLKGVLHCFTGNEIQLYKDLIDIGFYDVFYEKNFHEYTWWDYRINKSNLNNGARIDHFFCNQNKNFDAKVLKEYRLMERPSDHAPIVLESI
ncbi:MAG: phosphoribosylamine--glycine ligase [Fusobacterium sp.]